MKNKKKEKLPGYPHYAEGEDIMNPERNDQRMDLEVENLSSSLNKELKEKKPVARATNTNTSPEIVPGTESDVTKKDLRELGPVDRDLDEGDDENIIPNIQIRPDLSGDDLDIPGTELDDDSEDIGSEDEENNYYSRGQD